MMNLTSVSDGLTLVTGSAHNISVHASWVDLLAGVPTPGRTNTLITTATTTTIVAAPAASTQRNVKTLTISNTDATNTNLVTIKHTDGTNNVTVLAVTLQPGYTLMWTDANGIELLDVS